MSLKVTLSADERGKPYLDRNENGGGNVEFCGGSFWIHEIPSDMDSGAYDEIVFDAGLFRGAVSTRNIVSFSRKNGEGQAKSGGKTASEPNKS